MKRISIPASPNHSNPKMRFTHEVFVVLPDDLENDYHAAGKEHPEGLPTSWHDPVEKKDKDITWISNFGLTQNGKHVKDIPEGKKYKVLLPKSGRSYVYWDGSAVRALPVNLSEMDADSLEAELELADPPVGMSMGIKK